MTPRHWPASWSLVLSIVGFGSPAAAQTYRPIPLRIDPRAPAAAQRLEAITLFDSAYGRSRRIWVYTPKGYDPRATTTYPLVVAFDGAEYRDTMPLPLILDTLQATGRAPAFIAVLIDDSEGAVRIADLGNAAKMIAFLARQLMPYVRARWHVVVDPQRVIVTGSSAGGLAAAFVALQRPDLFGNVLSQSGAFWRGAEGSDRPPFEWLTAQVMGSPKRNVRLFVDVGEAEDHATLGGSGPNFRDANRRFRDALKAKGYQVEYSEIPEGQHGPAYWMTRLPVGIMAFTSGWR
jgi:enterochelin esterase-like enzyme